MLQRRHAEGVLDLEVGGLAVGALGADEVLVFPLEEARDRARPSEARVPEIAENGLVRGRLHRTLVVRAKPLA